MNKTGQQVKPTGQAGQRKETGLSRRKRDVWSPCLVHITERENFTRVLTEEGK